MIGDNHSYVTFLDFLLLINVTYSHLKDIGDSSGQITMSEEEIFSIDLVEAAIAQRKFLTLVDEHPCLYVGPHVQNALRRYD